MAVPTTHKHNVQPVFQEKIDTKLMDSLYLAENKQNTTFSEGYNSADTSSLIETLDLAITQRQMKSAGGAKACNFNLTLANQPKGNSSFTLFPELPHEIRQKIWNISISQRIQQRTIIISEEVWHEHESQLHKATKHSIGSACNSLVLMHRIKVLSEPLPNILVVCKEALQAGMFKPILCKGASKSPLYSPIFDNIRLASVGHGPQMLLSSAIDHETLDRIRHITLDVDLWDKDIENWCFANLRLLTALKTVNITRRCVIMPGFHAPPNINFSFTSVPNMSGPTGLKLPTVYLPVCVADGRLRRGGEALEAIFQRVTDNFEQHRFITLWGFMNGAAQQCKNLPPTISVCFRYTVYSWTSDPGSDGVVVNERQAFDYGDVIDGLVTLD